MSVPIPNSTSKAIYKKNIMNEQHNGRFDV